MAFKPAAFTSTTGAQIRPAYDASNYADFTVNSGGDLTIAPTGGDTSITGTLTVSAALSATTGAFSSSLTVSGTSGGGVGTIRLVAGVFKMQAGTGGFTVANSANSGDLLTLSDAGALAIPGTLAVTGASTLTGNVGIGGSAGAAALTVLEETATQKVALFENNHTSTPYGVYIDYSGATKNNAAYPFLQCEDATAVRLDIWSNGNVVNANGSYGTISDERLKTDIAPANSQWEDVKWLGANAINYRFLADGDEAITLLGWGAQSVESAGMGGLVELTGEDEDTYTLKTSIIHTKAVVALGEALVRIEALETQLAAM